jgi:methyl-accepting chemotaxis protein
MQAIQAGKGSGFNTKVGPDENGESVFAGFAVSSDVNRHAVVITKKQAAIAQPIDAFVGQLGSKIAKAGQELRQNMILIALATSVTAFLLAWFLLKSKITVPIAKLTRVSEKLAQGDIDGLQIDVSGNDEIGKFGESFKGVLAAFHLLMEEAEKSRK